MQRRTPVAASAIVLVAILAAPAAAQFGSIFGEPPRPPSAIPGGRQSAPAPPSQNYPPAQPNYPPAQPNYPPQSAYPPPGAQPQGVPPGGIQSRPLPPPQTGAVDPAPRATPPRQRGP